MGKNDDATGIVVKYGGISKFNEHSFTTISELHNLAQTVLFSLSSLLD